MGLRAVGAQLLGQGPVPIAEGGHQAGPELHLNLTGVGADGDAPACRGGSGPRHATEHVDRLLDLDGHLLWLGRLLYAQAGQCHVGRRGTVLRLLLEDGTAGGEALKLGGRCSTWGERSPRVTTCLGYLRPDVMGATEGTQLAYHPEQCFSNSRVWKVPLGVS